MTDAKPTGDAETAGMDRREVLKHLAKLPCSALLLSTFGPTSAFASDDGYDAAEHYYGMGIQVDRCIGCHDPHDPAPPMTPESCSACHAQIARTKAISHHATLDCQTCHEAQPEHRESPRANLPKKPTENAFCGQCHAEGADAPASIPRVDVAAHSGRDLCWQCHYPHFPEAGG